MHDPDKTHDQSMPASNKLAPKAKPAKSKWTLLLEEYFFIFMISLALFLCILAWGKMQQHARKPAEEQKRETPPCAPIPTPTAQDYFML